MVRWAAAVLFALSGCLVAAADDYPSRPIRLIVTFPPGGSADVMGRAIQPHLERELGQPIVIENRTGAGGVTGIEAVVRSAPDGYTIGLGAPGALAVNLSLREKMPYDPFTELAPISGLAKTPFILAAAPNFEPNGVRDVVALAKQKPGAVAIGHGGNGTAMDLTARLFTQMAGISMTLVPYRGTGPATQDLVAGHIPLAITDPPTAVSLVQSKQIKALAVTTKERLEAMPDLPTMDEALPGYESIGWFGVVAPARTPTEIIAKLSGAIVTALKDPGMLERTRSLGAIPMPLNPTEFAHYIRSEYEKWAAVVARTGAKEP
jgi:tripartite-type tricarboxylate transporter receptor subunit TctC